VRAAEVVVRASIRRRKPSGSVAFCEPVAR
jgi:hypothetical protein